MFKSPFFCIGYIGVTLKHAGSDVLTPEVKPTIKRIVPESDC